MMPLPATDLMLIPTPRHVQILGEPVDVPLDAAPLELLIGGDIDPVGRLGQSYEVRILRQSTSRRGDVELRSGSLAGLRHARATLDQLRRRFGTRLPSLIIADEPSFAVRGVMLDVSRDRIPTMAEFARIVDLLAALKFNHLQLYTEHTFAYAGHEDVWRGWSPITPEEARTLDAMCRARGIALVANQNCFGHLGAWFRVAKYAPLAETHGDWVFDGWPRSGPFSLCPTDPASLALVEDLLGQLLANFSTPLVNIGCDETYDVGFGRSKPAVEARGGGDAGRAAVYAEFVSKVCGVASRRGFRPMFWADIALSHAQALQQLPADLISLAWGYEPDAPFARWCETVRGAGASRQVWVCPGTSSWRSIFGRTTERRANIAAAASQGAAAGAPGFLICDWGDTGHHQQWPVVAMALANAAQAAWNAPRAAEFDPRAGALHAVIGPEVSAEAGGAAADPWSAVQLANQLGPWMESLGDCDLHLRETCLGLSRIGQSGRLRNQSALFIDLHNHRGTACAEVGAPADWRLARERVRAAEGELPVGLPERTRDELRHTLEVAGLAADRACARRDPGGLAAPMAELAERARGILQEHRRLWAARSREGGLENSCRHYQRVIEDLAGKA